MPSSIVGELFVRFLLETVLYSFGYATGWLLVPVLTFGRYTADPVPPPNPRKYKNRGIPKSELGPRTLSFDATAAIGILFWLVVGTLAALVWWASKP